MLRKFIKPKSKLAETPEAPIDLQLLEQHLGTIKVCMLEIRGFRQKKIVKSPTFHFMQKIDLEEAWPTCRQPLRIAYGLLCKVADSLDVEYEEMPQTASFGRSIDQFVNLVDRISLFLEADGGAALSEANMRTIDEAILVVQHHANSLQKKVMVDFVFTRRPTG
jgi:hypothetical protein